MEHIPPTQCHYGRTASALTLTLALTFHILQHFELPANRRTDKPTNAGQNIIAANLWRRIISGWCKACRSSPITWPLEAAAAAACCCAWLKMPRSRLEFRQAGNDVKGADRDRWKAPIPMVASSAAAYGIKETTPECTVMLAVVVGLESKFYWMTSTERSWLTFIL